MRSHAYTFLTWKYWLKVNMSPWSIYNENHSLLNKKENGAEIFSLFSKQSLPKDISINQKKNHPVKLTF